MIDKNDLESIKKDIEAFDKERDYTIKASREIIKLSKKVIYAVHRADLKSAEKALGEMDAEVKKLKDNTKHPKLLSSGSYKVAIQEYVEALCFFELI